MASRLYLSVADPQASLYEIHIVTKDILGEITDPTQTLNIPPEYYAAIHYNLSVRLAPAFGRRAPPEVVAMAKESLNVLRQANNQVGLLGMPAELLRSGIYNPYSDQSH